MSTFLAGGLTFTVEFTAEALGRLRAAGFDLPRMVREPDRLAGLFDRPGGKFGEFLFTLLEPQIPADWTPERFAREVIKAGAASPEAVGAAFEQWAKKEFGYGSQRK